MERHDTCSLKLRERGADHVDETLHRGAEVIEFFRVDVVRFILALELPVDDVSEGFHRCSWLRYRNYALGCVAR